MNFIQHLVSLSVRHHTDQTLMFVEFDFVRKENLEMLEWIAEKFPTEWDRARWDMMGYNIPESAKLRNYRKRRSTKLAASV